MRNINLFFCSYLTVIKKEQKGGKNERKEGRYREREKTDGRIRWNKPIITNRREERETEVVKSIPCFKTVIQ